MAERQQIVLEMISDSKGAVVGVRKLDDSVSKLDKSTKNASKSTDSLGQSFAKAKGAFIAAAAAIAAIGVALGKAVRAASEFEEANAKFGTVFRGVSREANAMRKELVASYGLSAIEATKMLASVQDLFVPLGLARDKAAELSSETVKLARDVASFNDLPTVDVLRDFQSAMVGNFETVRKYGVVISAASLKQSALEQGIQMTNGEIGAQDRAMLALQKITEGSADALGDYNRTQGSTANTARDMKKMISDLTVVLGQELLVAIKPVVEALSRFAKMEGGIAKVRKAFKVLAVIFQSSWQFSIKPVFIGMQLLLTPVIEGIKGMVEAFQILRDESLSTREKLVALKDVAVETFKSTVDAVKGTAVEYVEDSKTVLNNWVGVFTQVEADTIAGMDRIVEAGNAASDALTEAAKAAADNSAASSAALGESFTAGIKELGKSSEDIFVAWAKGGKTVGEAIDRMKERLADFVLSSVFKTFASTLLNLIAPGGGAAIGAFLGFFKEGGFTGHGRKEQPAGIVHKGEYVIKADRVTPESRKLFDAINFGAYLPARAGPGYQAGGLVGRTNALSTNDIKININVSGLDSVKWDELARDRIVPSVNRALNEMNRSIL